MSSVSYIQAFDWQEVSIVWQLNIVNKISVVIIFGGTIIELINFVCVRFIFGVQLSETQIEVIHIMCCI